MQRPAPRPPQVIEFWLFSVIPVAMHFIPKPDNASATLIRNTIDKKKKIMKITMSLIVVNFQCIRYRMGATIFVQPLDLVKTRMQISGVGGAKKEYKNTFDAFTSILRKEGVTGIYRGLGAGLLRQATYTTTRLGVYTGLNDVYRR